MKNKRHITTTDITKIQGTEIVIIIKIIKDDTTTIKDIWVQETTTDKTTTENIENLLTKV